MVELSSVVSYISYREIAEALDIVTNTDFVVDGVVTPLGIESVFEKINKMGVSDEERHNKENELLKELVDNYVSPEDIVKNLNWEECFTHINNYTARGSNYPFLRFRTTGTSIEWFKTDEGIHLSLYDPIMIFIEDIHYSSESQLPDFDFDTITAHDVITAISLEIIPDNSILAKILTF